MKKVRSFEFARDAIKAVEPELIKDNWVQDEARWEKLAELARKFDDISSEEFVEIYRESRKKKDAIAVSQKLADSPTSTPAKGSARAKAKTRHDPLDLNQISEDDAIW
jgi:hypothetical protein